MWPQPARQRCRDDCRLGDRAARFAPQRWRAHQGGQRSRHRPQSRQEPSPGSPVGDGLMDYLWLILMILIGLVVSGFFSGMETGLISLNRVRLRHEVERKDRRALILNRF